MFFSLRRWTPRRPPVVDFCVSMEEPIPLEVPDSNTLTKWLFLIFSFYRWNGNTRELKPNGSNSWSIPIRKSDFLRNAKNLNRSDWCRFYCQESWSGSHVHTGHAGCLCAFNILYSQLKTWPKPLRHAPAKRRKIWGIGEAYHQVKIYEAGGNLAGWTKLSKRRCFNLL